MRFIGWRLVITIKLKETKNIRSISDHSGNSSGNPDLLARHNYSARTFWHEFNPASQKRGLWPRLGRSCRYRLGNLALAQRVDYKNFWAKQKKASGSR
jgi:hypothetical protein